MKSLIIPIVLSSTLIFTACSGEPENSESTENKNSTEEKVDGPYAGSPLLGTWEITEAEGTMSDSNIGTVYEFSADGTFKMDGHDGKLTTTTDTSFTFTRGKSDSEYSFQYKFEGEKLILTPGNGNSGQVFYLDKK